MTTLTHPVPAAPPPWSDVADVIWRRSLAEQHAATCDDDTCTYNESLREGQQ